MSTRPRRSPEPDDERDGWLRPIVFGVSCLVIGFVLGYVVRGGGGGSSALVERPPVTTAPVTTAAPPATAPTAPAGTAPTGTAPAGTAPADTTVNPPTTVPARAGVRMAVLNGTGVTGLAGRTADRAEGLGYVDVTAGNAPPQTGDSVVYYRPGARVAAEQAASDLEVYGGVMPLPASGGLAEAAPPDADVIVVLGPGTG